MSSESGKTVDETEENPVSKTVSEYEAGIGKLYTIPGLDVIGCSMKVGDDERAQLAKDLLQISERLY